MSYRLTVIIFALASWSCATAPSVAEIPFEDGTQKADLLIDADRIALTQMFVGEGTAIDEAELLVARLTTNDSTGPLVVEVRNVGLNVRYGHGRISAFDGEENVAHWKPVEWTERPRFPRMEPLVLVVFARKDADGWGVAARTDPMRQVSATLLGKYRLPSTAQGPEPEPSLGVRLRFDSGQVTHSSLQPGLVGIARAPIRVKKRAYGVSLDDGLLPECEGHRCVSYYSRLRPVEDDRRRVAAHAFQLDDDGRARMKSPVTGVSCIDACTAVGKAGCYALEYTSPQRGGPEGRFTCDRVMSSVGEPESLACVCTERERDWAAHVEEADDRRRIIREGYTTEEGKIRRRVGGMPYGVTIREICEASGYDFCQGARCDAVLLPHEEIREADCHRRDGRPAHGTSSLGDRFLVSKEGQLFIVEPATATVRPLKQRASVAPISSRNLVGDFHVARIARPARGSQHSGGHWWELINLETGEVTTSDLGIGTKACQPFLVDDRVNFVCKRDATFEVKNTDGSTIEVTPQLNGPWYRASSWDGEVLFVKGSYGESRWQRGDSEWRRHAETKLDHLEPRWGTARILDALYQVRPERFVNGLYFDAGKPEQRSWIYRVETGEFWASSIRGELVASKRLVRQGSYLFDPETFTWRLVARPPLAWAKHYGLFRVDECSGECRSLPAPLDGYAVRRFTPDNFDVSEVVEPTKVLLRTP